MKINGKPRTDSYVFTVEFVLPFLAGQILQTGRMLLDTNIYGATVSQY